ncbi:MAG: biotin--[acetyl-CoA-carboxylase] ligase [Acidobacteriota bacterium]|nr:biotin--[acetyl-CoA-carboxylase] ligase [Acidobacteriota bacterium]
MSAGRLIRHFSTIDSTNDHALTLAASGAPDGSVVSADEQTAGRGRRGREWHSPEGGLYLSYIVRGLDRFPKPSLLTLAAGVAVARAIASATGLVAQLKWPNDVITSGAPLKLAGVLAEGSSVAGRLEYVVIGIGINVMLASVPAELAGAASSLEHELGRAVDRPALQAALVGELDAAMAGLRRGAHGELMAAWGSLAPGGRGAPVSWRAGEDLRRGVTEGVDDDGALLVRGAAGLERLVAGEVIWA